MATSAIRSACADGGAILKSLGEERRCSVAVLRSLDASRWKKPLLQTSKEVGRSRHSSNRRRMPVIPIAHTSVSNILDSYLLTFFVVFAVGRDASARGVRVMVKEGNHVAIDVWLGGPTIRLIRDSRTSFTTAPRLLVCSNILYMV